jgi:hypothetical protein
MPHAGLFLCDLRNVVRLYSFSQQDQTKKVNETLIKTPRPAPGLQSVAKQALLIVHHG